MAGDVACGDKRGVGVLRRLGFLEKGGQPGEYLRMKAPNERQRDAGERRKP
jgi:hypothetical protein